MIERFLFPDGSGSTKQLVDAMGGRTFQALHDFDQRDRPAPFISQSSEQQMNVIGHDHCGK
jgi:hypothetical protein